MARLTPMTREFEIRPMTAFDIPFGLSLSTQAGWNQTEHDWRLLLSSGRNGGWVALYEGQPVGTLTTVHYPPHIDWVGMVLVHESFRQRGIATRLIKTTIDRVGDNRSLYLDATPMGEGLYRKFGFEAEYGLVRMVGSRSRVGEKNKKKTSPLPADLDRITRLDRLVFGSDRGSILSALVRDIPNTVIVTPERDDFTDFCLGREGRIYYQLGPLVARNMDAAQNLLRNILACLGDRSVILDVIRENADWVDWLRSIGFQELRTFTRMRYGKNFLETQMQSYFAALGPEFG